MVLEMLGKLLTTIKPKKIFNLIILRYMLCPIIQEIAYLIQKYKVSRVLRQLALQIQTHLLTLMGIAKLTCLLRV